MNNLYLDLENKMVHYRSLTQVAIKENHERLVVVNENTIPNGYLPKMQDMKKIIGSGILVRAPLFDRLIKAQEMLQCMNNDLSLFVSYGYRTVEIQTERFLKRLQQIKIFFVNSVDLYEAVHRSVAVPSVAGHPTGGAIDVSLVNTKTNTLIDFGTDLYDYSSKDCYVFSPKISKKAYHNRLLLRDCMLKNEFAPFDGEWWHFSYGDREWAFYYKEDYGFYDQISLKNLKFFYRD